MLFVVLIIGHNADEPPKKRIMLMKHNHIVTELNLMLSSQKL